MTQDERWMIQYNEVVEFIQTNQRNPLSMWMKNETWSITSNILANK